VVGSSLLQVGKKLDVSQEMQNTPIAWEEFTHINGTLYLPINHSMLTGLLCSEPFEHCVLSNVCVDVDGVIRLLADSEERIGELQADIKKVLRNDDHPRGYAFKKMKSLPFEGNATELSSLPRFSSASIVIAHGAPENCGHIIGDEAWPIFRLVTELQGPGFYIDHPLDHFHKYGVRSKCDLLVTPMARRVVNHDGSKDFEGACYDRVYIGHGGFSYIDDEDQKRAANFERDMKLFRAMYHRSARTSFPNGTADTILVMVKRFGVHMANLENVEELAKGIQGHFPHYHVNLTSWSDFTWTEQLHILSRTRAIVSLPGSDVMNAVFLQDQAAVLMFCRVMGRSSIEDSREQTLWLRRLSYLNSRMIACKDVNVSYSIPKRTTKVHVSFVVDNLKAQGL
jgi:hypothetical protein